MIKEKDNKDYMVIKIDLAKAYDRLSWKFIREILEMVGFKNKWCWNIMNCVEGAKLTILWNGERSEWFKPSRGIRQGDSKYCHSFLFRALKG